MPNTNPPAEFQIEIQSHIDQQAAASRAAHLPPLPVNFADELTRVIEATIVDRGGGAACIEVAIVDDPCIREVNRRHLGHDWETDVISFPEEAVTSPLLSVKMVAGELLVSWETACREAVETGWPPLTELSLYCIHGTLHLTGMDDLETTGRHAMRRAEQQMLSHLRLPGWQLYDVDTDQAGGRAGGNHAGRPLEPPPGDAAEAGR
ncbi:rRNA maturation RNase YbeY [Planctomycetaceae bacterium SH139]